METEFYEGCESAGTEPFRDTVPGPTPPAMEVTAYNGSTFTVKLTCPPLYDFKGKTAEMMLYVDGELFGTYKPTATTTSTTFTVPSPPPDGVRVLRSASRFFAGCESALGEPLEVAPSKPMPPAVAVAAYNGSTLTLKATHPVLYDFASTGKKTAQYLVYFGEELVQTVAVNNNSGATTQTISVPVAMPGAVYAVRVATLFYEGCESAKSEAVAAETPGPLPPAFAVGAVDGGTATLVVTAPNVYDFGAAGKQTAEYLVYVNDTPASASKIAAGTTHSLVVSTGLVGGANSIRLATRFFPGCESALSEPATVDIDAPLPSPVAPAFAIERYDGAELTLSVTHPALAEYGPDGQNTAAFLVYLDGVLAQTVAVGAASPQSVSVNVPVAGADYTVSVATRFYAGCESARSAAQTAKATAPEPAPPVFAVGDYLGSTMTLAVEPPPLHGYGPDGHGTAKFLVYVDGVLTETVAAGNASPQVVTLPVAMPGKPCLIQIATRLRVGLESGLSNPVTATPPGPVAPSFQILSFDGREITLGITHPPLYDFGPGGLGSAEFAVFLDDAAAGVLTVGAQSPQMAKLTLPAETPTCSVRLATRFRPDCQSALSEAQVADVDIEAPAIAPPTLEFDRYLGTQSTLILTHPATLDPAAREAAEFLIYYGQNANPAVVKAAASSPQAIAVTSPMPGQIAEIRAATRLYGVLVSEKSAPAVVEAPMPQPPTYSASHSGGKLQLAIRAPELYDFGEPGIGAARYEIYLDGAYFTNLFARDGVQNVSIALSEPEREHTVRMATSYYQIYLSEPGEAVAVPPIPVPAFDEHALPFALWVGDGCGFHARGDELQAADIAERTLNGEHNPAPADFNYYNAWTLRMGGHAVAAEPGVFRRNHTPPTNGTYARGQFTVGMGQILDARVECPDLDTDECACLSAGFDALTPYSDGSFNRYMSAGMATPWSGGKYFVLDNRSGLFGAADNLRHNHLASEHRGDSQYFSAYRARLYTTKVATEKVFANGQAFPLEMPDRIDVTIPNAGAMRADGLGSDAAGVFLTVSNDDGKVRVLSAAGAVLYDPAKPGETTNCWDLVDNEGKIKLVLVPLKPGNCSVGVQFKVGGVVDERTEEFYVSEAKLDDPDYQLTLDWSVAPEAEYALGPNGSVEVNAALVATLRYVKDGVEQTPPPGKLSLAYGWDGASKQPVSPYTSPAARVSLNRISAARDGEFLQGSATATYTLDDGAKMVVKKAEPVERRFTVFGIGAIKVRRTGSGDEYGDAAVIAAGGYRSDLHCADLRFVVKPGPMGRAAAFAIGFNTATGSTATIHHLTESGEADPASVILNGVGPDGAARGTVNVPALAGEVAAKLRSGGVVGEFVLSGSDGTAGPAIRQAWGGMSHWQYDDYTYWYDRSPVSNRSWLEPGVPLDGHMVRFSVERVEGQVWDGELEDWTDLAFEAEEPGDLDFLIYFGGLRGMPDGRAVTDATGKAEARLWSEYELDGDAFVHANLRVRAIDTQVFTHE